MGREGVTLRDSQQPSSRSGEKALFCYATKVNLDDVAQRFTCAPMPLFHRVCFFLSLLVLSSASSYGIELRLSDEVAVDQERTYNLRFGTLELDFAYAGSLVASDNTNRATTDSAREDGLRMGNGLEMGVYWPINQRLIVDSGISISRISYLSGTGTEGWVLQGDDAGFAANFDVDLRLGQDGLFTVRETVSHRVDGIEADEVDNTADFSLWQNAFAIQYENEFYPGQIAAVEVSRNDVWSPKAAFSYRDYAEHAVEGYVGREINSRATAGLFARVADLQYGEEGHNDSQEYTVGVQTQYLLHERLGLHAMLGYQLLDFAPEHDTSTTDDGEGAIASLSVSHRISEFLSQQLTIGFSREQGTGSDDAPGSINYSDDLSAHHYFDWQITHRWSIHTHLGYLHTNDSDDAGETAGILSSTLGIWRLMGSKGRVGVAYSYTEKDSDQDGRDYDRNEVGVQLNYDF